ncbi:MAG: TrkA family potassium uptake protein, partial [Halobacteriovoraceae bacterium]|nr:TrkA family potassium uptake protein [Halobacteriovoraceae bacterium]
IDQNPGAIIYTTLLMFIGMGIILYSTSLMTAYIVDGNLRNAFSRERIKRRVSRMKDHYIICGAGETGIHVVREMIAVGKPCVVIEHDEEMKKELLTHFPQLPIIVGDATMDSVLHEAEIDNAQGLVAALSNDKDNLFLTVTAKMLQPKLSIVARAIDISMEKKLKRAGASRVVSPNFIGGMRMASEVLRPHVTNFLDRMLRGKDQSIRIEEVVIPSNSKWIGKKIGEADFFQNCGINVMALGKGTDHYHYNPGPDVVLDSGDVLLFIGTPDQEKSLEDLIS